jgi:hypothetical protein
MDTKVTRILNLFTGEFSILRVLAHLEPYLQIQCNLVNPLEPRAHAGLTIFGGPTQKHTNATKRSLLELSKTGMYVTYPI